MERKVDHVGGAVPTQGFDKKLPGQPEMQDLSRLQVLEDQIRLDLVGNSVERERLRREKVEMEHMLDHVIGVIRHNVAVTEASSE